MQECLEIRRDFDGDVPLRVKRLAKDPGNSLEATAGNTSAFAGYKFGTFSSDFASRLFLAEISFSL